MRRNTTMLPRLSTLRTLRTLTLATLIAGTVLAPSGAAPVAAAGPCGTALFSGDANRIGNQVFVDANDNARFEIGEAGIAGVRLELWLDVDDDGAFEPTGDDASGLACSTTTDPNGRYWFDHVASGNYFLAARSGVPAGYVSSTGLTADLVTDNRDDGAPTAGLAAVTTLLRVDSGVAQPRAETGPGAVTGADEIEANASVGNVADTMSNLTIDLGFVPPAPPPPCLGLGNRVWLDVDGDGIRDAAERGIDGVKVDVFLADAAGRPTGTARASTVTMAGGYYLFPCLTAGTYVVVVDNTNFAAGAALSGLVSTTDDVGQPASGDVDTDDDGRTSNGIVVSAPVALAPGAAPTAEPDKPAGALDFDSPTDANVDTEVDFGFTGLTIGNRVWRDTPIAGTNADGVQSGSEPGIAGVSVELWASDGTGPTGAGALRSTRTDTNGYYLFTGLTPGHYVVQIPAINWSAGNSLAGLVSTTGNGVAPDVDANPADRDDNGDGPSTGPVRSLPITLAHGSEPTGEADLGSAADARPADENANVTVDFGFVAPPPVAPITNAIGDFVWIDANLNGIQDAGENAIPNVTVVLRAPNGETLSTVTNAEGRYRFGNLPAGTYAVCVDLGTIPAGLVATIGNSGTDDAIDSDANRSGCIEGVVPPTQGENLTFDFGFAPAGSADLSVDKTATAANGRITWSVVVTNNGPSAAFGGTVVVDTLPKDVAFVSATGACSYDKATHAVTCTIAEPLASGAKVTISLVTTAKTTTTNTTGDCKVTNTVTIGSAATAPVATDPNPANNTDSATITTPCAQGTDQRRPNLPVTGSGALAMGGGALMIALAGWRLLSMSGKLRQSNLDKRLGL